MHSARCLSSRKLANSASSRATPLSGGESKPLVGAHATFWSDGIARLSGQSLPCATDHPADRGLVLLGEDEVVHLGDAAIAHSDDLGMGYLPDCGRSLMGTMLRRSCTSNRHVSPSPFHRLS